ncbi:MAG: hypothetical protein QM781_20045 [Chitinophagaceae bacterium]
MRLIRVKGCLVTFRDNLNISHLSVSHGNVGLQTKCFSKDDKKKPSLFHVKLDG